MPAPEDRQTNQENGDTVNGSDDAAPRAHDFARSASSSSQIEQQQQSSQRRQPRPKRQHSNQSTASTDSAASFAGDAAETYQEARQAFEKGTASPYFVAVVALLCSLSQGLPLASMFKVYTFLICEVYDEKDTHGLEATSPPTSSVWTMTSSAASSIMGIKIPPAPELPHPPQCNSPAVQQTTSAYAAAMATVGALLALTLLDRVTKISRHFGRKPIMLLPQLLIALAFVGFRVSVMIPQYAGTVFLFCAVVIFEASAGAPLRISIQNYIVDTTHDSQRAAALSFIEGFGQLGAFPSSTIGGFLAAITGEFFAPFYASIAVALVTFVFILILVPESKKHRHHTLIDNWEHSEDISRRQQLRQRESYMSGANDSYISTETNESVRKGWKHHLRQINFLQPLAVFLPTRHSQTSGSRRRRGTLDFRLLNLAFIVVFEETFQVFLVPMLLLFNSDVFGFDVLQNGYLVSLLQATRCFYLTIVFPPAVSVARRWISQHVQKQKEKKRQSRQGSDGNDSSPGESSPLLSARPDNDRRASQISQAASEMTANTVATKDEQRGKLDVFLMVFSYALATASFLLLASSRKVPFSTPWIPLALGVLGIQLSSGATNLRTALIVNAVSKEDQSTALAANQVLCTVVYASIPLVTSLVYGSGLERGLGEVVWLFKGGFAFLACLSSLALLVTSRGKSAKLEQAEEEQGER